jgi:hypothetical protein
MQSLVVALVAMLFLIGSPSSLVMIAQDDATPATAAEDATPEGDGEEAEGTNPVDPEIGDTVTYFGQNGAPVGTIVATEITRNWEDFGEFEEPDPGVEYISVTIEVESLTARGAIDLDPYRFTLQSPSGFFYNPAFVQGAEDLDVPVLTETVSLAGGETLETQVVFEVLEGEELAHLFWMPEGALLTVAKLEGE